MCFLAIQISWSFSPSENEARINELPENKQRGTNASQASLSIRSATIHLETNANWLPNHYDTYLLEKYFPEFAWCIDSSQFGSRKFINFCFIFCRVKSSIQCTMRSAVQTTFTPGFPDSSRKAECSSSWFMLLFTHKGPNLIVKRLALNLYPKTLNSAKKLEISYPMRNIRVRENSTCKRKFQWIRNFFGCFVMKTFSLPPCSVNAWQTRIPTKSRNFSESENGGSVPLSDELEDV